MVGSIYHGGEEMLSSNRGSQRRADQQRADGPNKGVVAPSVYNESNERSDPLSGCSFFENPYAPPTGLSELPCRIGIEQRALDAAISFTESLIEDARETPTTKLIAGIILCGGGALTVFSRLYAQLVYESLSVTDSPHTIMLGYALGGALLYTGTKCGIVLAHRAWKRCEGAWL